jgi:hypothetical protein
MVFEIGLNSVRFPRADSHSFTVRIDRELPRLHMLPNAHPA